MPLYIAHQMAPPQNVACRVCQIRLNPAGVTLRFIVVRYAFVRRVTVHAVNNSICIVVSFLYVTVQCHINKWGVYSRRRGARFP